MKQHLQKFIAVIISITILCMLYFKFDLSTLPRIFRETNYYALFLILIVTIAIYLLIAMRWKIMVEGHGKISYTESIIAVLSASALNIILPSKLGSFAKAYFLKKKGRTGTQTAISLAIYERLLDLSSISLLFIISMLLNLSSNSLLIIAFLSSSLILTGFILLHFINLFKYGLFKPLRRIKIIDKLIRCFEIIYTFTRNKDVTITDLVKIYSLTVLLWLMNAAQVILIFYLIRLNIPASVIIMNMFCSIFVGLLPISIAGLGTRDITIVYLFKGLISYSQAIIIGGLTSIIRYIIPTLIGIPVFNFMMFPARGKKRQNDLFKNGYDI